MFLVGGATSGPGQLVVADLLARGLPVRVLVRGEAQAARFRAQGAEARGLAARLARDRSERCGPAAMADQRAS